MRYSAALQYLDSFLDFERLPFEYRRQFNLRRMIHLLRWFGRPDRALTCVLIAGTKGKGSTASFLFSLLNANGCRVGLYTSPHLHDPRERIRVGNRLISKKDFARLIDHIRPVLKRQKRQIASFGPVTYFEIFTLVAILYFAQKRVDLGIFEVGMGGRLDATNVLNQKLSILTPVSLDHEEHLGRTLEKIAGEKAAIIKPGSIVISAEQDPEAKKVIEKQIRRQKAKGYWFGRAFRTLGESSGTGGGQFDFQTNGKTLRRLRIRLGGRFQISNAALALYAADLLSQRFGFRLEERSIRVGLKRTFWPGRFEVLERRSQTWVLDGAHNGASMKELALALRDSFSHREKVVIFGTSWNKTLKPILKELLPLSSSLIVTKSSNPRAQEPKVILEAAAGMGYRRPTFLSFSLDEAFELIKTLDLPRSIFVVTGSLFLVAEAREKLKCPKFT